eukprot:scaffold438179_cov23-Prasinocladus_malaysianus.AAC.1
MSYVYQKLNEQRPSALGCDMKPHYIYASRSVGHRGMVSIQAVFTAAEKSKEKTLLLYRVSADRVKIEKQTRNGKYITSKGA